MISTNKCNNIKFANYSTPTYHHSHPNNCIWRIDFIYTPCSFTKWLGSKYFTTKTKTRPGLPSFCITPAIAIPFISQDLKNTPNALVFTAVHAGLIFFVVLGDGAKSEICKWGQKQRVVVLSSVVHRSDSLHQNKNTLYRYPIFYRVTKSTQTLQSTQLYLCSL